jgi:hypothetical protein
MMMSGYSSADWIFIAAVMVVIIVCIALSHINRG